MNANSNLDFLGNEAIHASRFIRATRIDLMVHGRVSDDELAQVEVAEEFMIECADRIIAQRELESVPFTGVSGTHQEFLSDDPRDSFGPDHDGDDPAPCSSSL
jgi:hypothetical protein